MKESGYMQDGVKLERKTKEELKQIAQGLGIEKISALKKDEIIASIRERREKAALEEKQNVHGSGFHKKTNCFCVFQ